MTTARLDRLYQLISSTGLDAIAINPGPSLFYLTGLNFHLMERPTVLLLAPPATPALVMPELELPKVTSSRLPLTPFAFGDNSQTWGKVFTQAATALQLDGKRVGMEPTRLRFLELSYLNHAAPKAIFVSGEGVFSQLRIQKDAEEIAAMRQAAVIAQKALTATLPMAKPGVTERELAAELAVQLLRAGSDSELPFAPIVASGPNSANPHAVPSDRKVERGDLLLFDWGASYRGYASDITRTFGVGQLSDELRQIYQLVKEANAAGQAPGVRVCAPATSIMLPVVSFNAAITVSFSPTVPATVWAWKVTKRRTCSRKTIFSCRKGWFIPWNRVFTCPAKAACASKMIWSSPLTVQPA